MHHYRCLKLNPNLPLKSLHSSSCASHELLSQSLKLHDLSLGTWVILQVFHQVSVLWVEYEELYLTNTYDKTHEFYF